MLYREDNLLFNNKTYLVRIFVERRRSVYLSIGRAVHIRLPSFLSEKKREEEIFNMKNKFLEYLKKNETKFAPISYKAYNHGDLFKIFDREYLLNFEYKNKKSSSAKIVGQTIYFSLSSTLKDKNKTISSLLNKILSQELLVHFKERVNYFNNLFFKQKLKSIKLKNNISKFGSCSHDKALVFSNSLLLARKDVIDYVIVHELAHTIHHNHSKSFWRLVATVVPDYKEKNKWLRENRARLII